MQPTLIHENLKAAREALGITRVEAARRMNIPQSSYVRYENGVRRPTYSTIIQMAQILNTSADYLIGKTTSNDADSILIKKDSNPELFEIAKGSENFSEDQIKRLLMYYNELKDMSDK